MKFLNGTVPPSASRLAFIDGLKAGIISIVLAFLRMNIMFVVFGGILGVYLWGMLI
jgi:hypothetical protein